MLVICSNLYVYDKHFDCGDIVCVFEMSSDQKDQGVLDVNMGCARKPGAISEADESNGVDACDAKTLVNEDKHIGSTTASDAPSYLIALSQEENRVIYLGWNTAWVRSEFCTHQCMTTRFIVMFAS